MHHHAPCRCKQTENKLQMATLRLYLDTRAVRADGTYPIKLAVNHHGGTSLISLNQFIRKDEWDRRMCRVRKRSDKDAINDYLLDRLNFYNKMMMQTQCRDTYRGDITAKQLRDLILSEAEPKKPSSPLLHDILLRYIHREMRESTRKNYESTWNSVKRFDANADNLTLENVNREWVEKFNLFLISEGKVQNTRTVRLRHIAAVFSYAIDLELTNNYPFRRFNLSLTSTKFRDLTVEELRAVLSADIPPRREHLLDAFRLSFYLIGINTNDMFNLTESNIVRGRLEYRRLKTGKDYSILLQPETLELIRKYEGKDKLLSFCERYKSSSIFSTCLNTALHDIKEGMTMYYARHTWATLAFKLGISKDTISLALGHSFGVRVTSTYINTDLARVDEANRRVLDWVLYDKK